MTPRALRRMVRETADLIGVNVTRAWAEREERGLILSDGRIVCSVIAWPGSMSGLHYVVLAHLGQHGSTPVGVMAGLEIEAGPSRDAGDAARVEAELDDDETCGRGASEFVFCVDGADRFAAPIGQPSTIERMRLTAERRFIAHLAARYMRGATIDPIYHAIVNPGVPARPRGVRPLRSDRDHRVDLELVRLSNYSGVPHPAPGTPGAGHAGADLAAPAPAPRPRPRGRRTRSAATDTSLDGSAPPEGGGRRLIDVFDAMRALADAPTPTAEHHRRLRSIIQPRTISS